MLQPELFSLSKLLSEKLYTIPDYQRSYSWESKQRKALFDDIKDLHKQIEKDPDAEHFMSTFVCLKRNPVLIGTTRFDKYDVVDGQQRLTTLIILLKSIELAMTQNSDERNELSKILIKSDKCTTPILLMNHDERQIFHNFITAGTIPDDDNDLQHSDIMLKEAILECRNFIDNWQKHNTLNELYALLKNNLYFVLHTIDQERFVYKTFEVLNSRGLPVEWLDRLKSMMMGTLFEKQATEAQIDSMHKIWSEIYRGMGTNKAYGSMAMRYLAALNGEYSRIKSEEDSAVELFKKCQGNINKTIKIADGIKILISDIKKLEANYFISNLIKIQHPRFLALCIIKSEFTDNEKQKLLKAWEKSTFKIFGLERKDARFKVGEYISLGQKIYKNTLTYKNALSLIKELSKDCDIVRAIADLKKTNIYEEWDEQFRYLMYQRELYLSSSSCRIAKNTWDRIWHTETEDTIEHILSQNSPSVVDDIRNESKTKIYKHRLGNLLILEARKNKSLQDMSPLDKVASYNDLLIEKEVAQLIEKNNGWTKTVVLEREDILYDWIQQQWGN